MIKVPTAEDQRQLKLQQHQFVAQTRLSLATQFLNAMIGRLDMELGNERTVDILPSLAMEYADSLMIKMGMVVKTATE